MPTVEVKEQPSFMVTIVWPSGDPDVIAFDSMKQVLAHLEEHANEEFINCSITYLK